MMYYLALFYLKISVLSSFLYYIFPWCRILDWHGFLFSFSILVMSSPHLSSFQWEISLSASYISCSLVFSGA
jgi:hypothetical protein